MYKVKLTKIRNNHNRLRSNEIIGIAQDLPKVGESFAMMSEALVIGVRLINTSPVQNIETINNKHQIFTESGSLYEVEVLEDTSEESGV